MSYTQEVFQGLQFLSLTSLKFTSARGECVSFRIHAGFGFVGAHQRRKESHCPSV